MKYDGMSITFGKYKGKTFSDLPIEYLSWLVKNNIAKGKLLLYCKFKLDLPKDNYRVVVTDSINSDGTYIVQAYNKKHAMSVCKEEHSIQCTQSFHGTGFEITKL